MKETILETGYAKINLHLDITGILPNGYHEVQTVMQTVSLCDKITLSDIKETAGSSRFSVTCNVPGVPCDERNLAVRAALLFCERSGAHITANIDIVKNIPMAAGMAGGSTDGAAVLRGLNRASEYPLSIDELCALGSELGADVPFCIRGGTLYADGKGDILHEFPKMPACHIVVACEGEGVSTPWAYGLLDKKYNKFDGSIYTSKDISQLKRSLSANDINAVAENMYNVFETPVLLERPIAARIKSILSEGGALRSMMSGSGPSVFGIFLCEKCAAHAISLLEQHGYRGYLCCPVYQDL